VTPEEIKRLIGAGETFTVEFKGERRERLGDDDLVVAVVCLANGSGGTILVGVEDDGEVTGARPRHEAGNTDTDRVAALIANQTQPPVACSAELATVDGVQVLVVEVPDSPVVVGTVKARYVRRATTIRGTPECVPYHAHEMLAHEVERGARDMAAIEVPGATWEDLDPLEFERLRRLVREAGGRGDRSLVELSDEDTAKALGVVTANHEIRAIRIGALLLFGREDALRRHVPTHEVAFQVLRGTAVEVNDFFRWPLLRVAEELVSRFRARNTEEEFQLGLVRVGVPAYPESAFREAVANSLVHRDYGRLGAVHVQWHENALLISNPGGFPPGINLRNLLVAPPRPRSPILADVFKRAGLVERTGKGIDLIFEGQLRYGRPAPDYSRSTREGVEVVLPGGPANLSLARYVAEQTGGGHRPSLDELLVLNELAVERRLSTARAAELMQVEEDVARSILNRMVDGGLVEARGERKGRTYHLSPAGYRAIGEPAAYIRVHGFEPLQQEQMMLQYVDAYGRITRREAADLCRLAPPQARRALRALVARGELVLRGARRGAYYERPIQ